MTTITTKSKNEKVQLHMTPLIVGRANLAAKFSQQKTHLGSGMTVWLVWQTPPHSEADSK